MSCLSLMCTAGQHGHGHEQGPRDQDQAEVKDMVFITNVGIAVNVALVVTKVRPSKNV